MGLGQDAAMCWVFAEETRFLACLSHGQAPASPGRAGRRGAGAGGVRRDFICTSSRKAALIAGASVSLFGCEQVALAKDQRRRPEAEEGGVVPSACPGPTPAGPPFRLGHQGAHDAGQSLG